MDRGNLSKEAWQIFDDRFLLNHTIFFIFKALYYYCLKTTTLTFIQFLTLGDISGGRFSIE